jgi:hypothetical protein
MAANLSYGRYNRAGFCLGQYENESVHRCRNVGIYVPPFQTSFVPSAKHLPGAVRKQPWIVIKPIGDWPTGTR